MTAAGGRLRTFWKMTGSGNDFVFFDARDGRGHEWGNPGAIARLCDRRRGVGADGVVLLEPGEGPTAFRMAYFNSDGSRASMCGNAALCSTRLATELGVASGAGFTFDSDAGRVEARIRDGQPEIDLAPLGERVARVPAVEPAGDELRVGFAVAGVPHVVVLCGDVSAVDLVGRGAALRRHPAFGSAGANANFVSRDARGEWAMRTFERGVEGETLACGTGAIASAALIVAWGLAAADSIVLRTGSGLPLGVRFQGTADGGVVPSLRGEGRIVYHGTLGEL